MKYLLYLAPGFKIQATLKEREGKFIGYIDCIEDIEPINMFKILDLMQAAIDQTLMTAYNIEDPNTRKFEN